MEEKIVHALHAGGPGLQRAVRLGHESGVAGPVQEGERPPRGAAGFVRVAPDFDEERGFRRAEDFNRPFEAFQLVAFDVDLEEADQRGGIPERAVERAERHPGASAPGGPPPVVDMGEEEIRFAGGAVVGTTIDASPSRSAAAKSIVTTFVRPSVLTSWLSNSKVLGNGSMLNTLPAVPTIRDMMTVYSPMLAPTSTTVSPAAMRFFIALKSVQSPTRNAESERAYRRFWTESTTRSGSIFFSNAEPFVMCVSVVVVSFSPRPPPTSSIWRRSSVG